MKLSKNFCKLELPDFKSWIMKLILEKSSKIRNQLVLFSTMKRLWVILALIIFITGLEFVAGFQIIREMNRQLLKSDRFYDKEIATISQLRIDLTKLPVAYNEDLSGISTRMHNESSKYIFDEINRQFHSLPLKNPGNPDYELFQASLKKIATDVKMPVAIKNYYELWAEAAKARIYLDRYAKQLYLTKQKHEAAAIIYRNTRVKESILLFLIVAGAIGIFLLIIREGRNHHQALIHFENIVRQLNQGKFQPGVIPYKTLEISALHDAINGYIERLEERFQSIIGKADELDPSIQELEKRVAENDNQHACIKRNLKDLSNKIYQKLEEFPDLSEQIKRVNDDLTLSRQEAFNLLDLIQQSGDFFNNGSEPIKLFQTQVEGKGRYFQAITDQLKELKLLLDEIQQTVASFYNISEQTNLLSLNAAIEAARAGEAGDNFSLAAVEIEELAVKINKASKDLFKLSGPMGKKAATVIRILETSLAQNKLEHKNLADVAEKMNNFQVEMTQRLTKIEEYRLKIRDFETEEQVLERLAVTLADLKKQSPVNRGKAIAALDVINETDLLVAATDELATNLIELKQNLMSIEYKPTPEAS